MGERADAQGLHARGRDRRRRLQGDPAGRLQPHPAAQPGGQTEAGPGGIYSGPEDVRARPDASGRYAIPNTEARIVTADGAEILTLP